MAPILAYWDMRGFANPIRMLLAHVDVRYEDKRYALVLGGPGHKEWFEKDKPALENTLDFPNLPYYIDGESKAILQYLGRKHGLDGTNEAELLRISLINEEVTDMKTAVGNVAYPAFCSTPPTYCAAPDKEEVFQTIKKDYLTGLPARLGRISRFLGERDFMAGSKLTWVDFFVYEILDWNRVFFKTQHVSEFGNLVAYMQRMEGLKGVGAFLNDKTKFSRLPVFAPVAMLGPCGVDYVASD